MSAFSHSRSVAGFPARVLAAMLFLSSLCAAQRTVARTPQSADAPAAQQQTSDPAKKDPAATTPVAAAAAKAKAPKPHRVFTNEDLSPNSGMPIPPGAYRRLKQLNRCDRTCFDEVKKQAITYGYINSFPRSTRVEMDDRLANTIEEVRNDPKWQQLLLEWISARIDSCLLKRKNSVLPEDSPPETPTRADLLDEEERMKNYRPPPSRNLNSADSAVLSYRFNMRPDPLRAALMFHEYMDEFHQGCPAVQSNANSENDSDDP
jgi:hypothetical protein